MDASGCQSKAQVSGGGEVEGTFISRLTGSPEHRKGLVDLLSTRGAPDTEVAYMSVIVREILYFIPQGIRCPAGNAT